jgi:hypothetical protein
LGAQRLFRDIFGESRKLGVLRSRQFARSGESRGKWEVEGNDKRTGLTHILSVPPHRYTFLSTSFNYTSRALSIGVKVALNQLAFTPVFNIYFFGAQALLSGDTFAEAWRRVCNTVPVSFVNSCKLWPAVTAFSFAFIPFEYRSVFGGVIAVGWQTYLSFLNGRAEKLEALRQKMEKDRQAVPLEKREKSPAAAVDMV